MPTSSQVRIDHTEYLQVIGSLGAPRFARYLTEAAGDESQALALYRWNTEMSAAIYESLHLVEVAVRNAMDGALRTWNAEQRNTRGLPHSPLWTISPSIQIAKRSKGWFSEAEIRAKKSLKAKGVLNPVPQHDDIVANLTFGYWVSLLPVALYKEKSPLTRLWNDGLSAAFPHQTRRPSIIVDHLVDLRYVRNRVAHLEPFELQKIEWIAARIDYVLESVSPDVAAWHRRSSRLLEVSDRHPSASCRHDYVVNSSWCKKCMAD